MPAFPRLALVALIGAAGLAFPQQAETKEQLHGGLLQLAQSKQKKAQRKCPGGSLWDVVAKRCRCGPGYSWDVSQQLCVGGGRFFAPRGSYESERHYEPRGSYAPRGSY